MVSVLLLVLISYAASQDFEPISEAYVFHVWDSGLEGAIYINPPEDIHSWVVHITLNQHMDVIEVSLFQNIIKKCPNYTVCNYQYMYISVHYYMNIGYWQRMIQKVILKQIFRTMGASLCPKIIAG